MGRLEIRLLGHFEAALDGQRISIATPRKSLHVIAYLLLHRGSPVSREYLAYLLYPDDEEAAARAKLRATLAELPKILPKPAVRYAIVQTDRVAWNPEADVWLDVEAFAQACADPERLSEAIELYRGDVLPEIYDDWLETIRERLRNLYLRCLSDFISQARRNANFGAGIEAARKLLALDPWREDVVRRVLAMRYESGDRAGALREYASFAHRLRDELGSEPMPETAAVIDRIARGDAVAETGDDRARAIAPSEAATLPFVGRRDEMERLLQAWSQAARGRGACAFVGGESGIGKSRLVSELARAVEERGGRVLFGTTGSPEAVPYEGVVAALRSALPLVASLKPSAALAGVASVIPEIHARVQLPALARLDAESERVRLFESFFRCIADLAKPRPLLLVLDDVHAAQPASLDLLRFLLNRIAGVPVMVAMTYRDEETPRPHGVHRLRRDARASVNGLNLWLGGLSSGEVEQIRTALPAIRGRSATALLAVSEGNPLFLTQLAVEAPNDEDIAPVSLRDAVRRRVERLSESTRSVAEIAACIGDRFSREAVREVSAWEDRALGDAFDELLDRRIVREAGGRGALEYVFTHGLVHETIASAIPAKDAAVRRRRVARVLEELYPEQFPELSATLAAHYACAGDAANAGRCYLQAVRRSISVAALEEAATLCERALELDLAIRTRVELLLELTTIAARRGRAEARASALGDLERADAELGDPHAHRQTLQRRINYAATAGDVDMQAAAVRALRASVPEGDPAWNAVAHLAESALQLRCGDLAGARRACEMSLACSREADDAGAVAGALGFLAKIEGLSGDVSLAAATLEEAARVAATAPDAALELLPLGSAWVVAYQQRDFERCLEIGKRCVELAVELGDRPAEALSRGRTGVALLPSDAGAARQNFAEATRIYQESGDRVGAAAQLMNRSVLEVKLGFFDRGAELATRALALFELVGDERGRLGTLSNLTYIRACTNDIAGAHEAGDGALADARREGFGWIEATLLENLAMAEGAVGNARRAIALAEASFAVRSRLQSQVWSSKTLADVALWYASVGDLAAALDAVHRLLADEASIARGADWPAYCYWCVAQIFRLSEEPESSHLALEQAHRSMMSEAGALEPDDRESFLRLPFHRDIARAVASDAWPSLK